MERIKQKIKIPIEDAEINVDTSKEEISKLINNIIFDEAFRVQLNTDPQKILRDAGIILDQSTIERLKESSLINSVLGCQGEPQLMGDGIRIMIVGIVISS